MRTCPMVGHGARKRRTMIEQRTIDEGAKALTVIRSLQEAMEDDPAFKERALDVLTDALGYAIVHKSEDGRFCLVRAYVWAMGLTGQERTNFEVQLLGTAHTAYHLPVYDEDGEAPCGYVPIEGPAQSKRQGSRGG